MEHCVREDLNAKALRRIAVLKPIRVIIDNYPADKTEYFDLPNHPGNPELGTRKVPFTKELYIDADDFAELPPPKFFRLKPDGEVRLMGAYIVKCGEICHDADGNVTEIHCTADLETGTGNPTDRKVKGTIHWLSAPNAMDTSVVLYDRLFTEENMNELPEGKTYIDFLNPESAVRLADVKVELALAEAAPGEKFQFVRIGYFAKDTRTENTFNRVVSLKDSYKPEN